MKTQRYSSSILKILNRLIEGTTNLPLLFAKQYLASHPLFFYTLKAAKLAAQVSNLLYRRFLIGRPSESPLVLWMSSGLETCATSDLTIIHIGGVKYARYAR